MVATSDVLHDFTKSTFRTQGRSRDVYRLGSGPAVLVLSEMPGITPKVAEFARRVAARGCTVVMPHLFGTDGDEPSTKAFAKSFLQVCVSREFTLFATGSPSSITSWLTDLARAEHAERGGPGVGVVGMCLTGGFALAMMVDPVVVAPVLSQPSLPAPLTKKAKALGDVGLTASQREIVAARAAAGQCVIGLRFTGDKMVPAQRFATLRGLLGDKFLGVEIDSSPGNPWGYPANAHCVLTEHCIETENSPTALALEQVLSFFSTQLGVGTP